MSVLRLIARPLLCACKILKAILQYFYLLQKPPLATKSS